ncbi:Protein-glutamate methylesterase/protein-glutamine glutaminase [Candidatus Methylobacter favarea]|uniref:Protein-glutamate methylesterase/protein-glutamine glutaminase n=1 Tax=Candidatus Methylobacter favarea TaxID=2707345 RepID=A0A8S0XIK7_9GAMM|nr:chemotaxis-specific protein-glutamate methyltransferase CheB [Candidatus Methylobacter favarea]CAA9890866.1 Protein-glutamate methylesterase/protein-glutamine glutaminase [Candidatus Methylobacter favarea]
MLKVLIIEDSPPKREFLIHLLASAPDILIIGAARNGDEALEAVQRYRPDVIMIDINMPKMGGLETARRIMETHPTPIVVVSGSAGLQEALTTFRAMEAGALALVGLPSGLADPNHDIMAGELLQTVKLMAEVKVVRRWPQAKYHTTAARQPGNISLTQETSRSKVIAIGASTGGPPVLQSILAALPKNFSLPLLIVQHMAPGFVQGFVDWLSQSCSMPVHVARHGEYIISGHVYVAPDEFQMKVEYGGKILLTRDELKNGLRPSVAYLFRSIMEVYGSGSVACLLTGMGRDGAEELRLLKETGAITLAQDKESSVVHGMPGEAIKLDAARFVLPPEKIAAFLIEAAKKYEKVPLKNL